MCVENHLCMVFDGKIIYAAEVCLPCFRHYIENPMSRSRPVPIKII
jgi:hypothetical protein